MAAPADPKKPLAFLRRETGLFVFDMDSTLIDGEGVDEFARERGCYDEIAAITEAAMRGEIDFDESLRRRIAKLKGLTLADIDRVYDRVPLMTGAAELIGELKLMGHKIGIISGGFDLLAERYARDVGGADALVMNQLEMVDGVCTGHVVLPIVNATEKANALVLVANELGIPLTHTVAIGDGANDIPMLGRAGFGIAFRGKPKLREVAKACIDEKDLRRVLDLM
jgi:phosphoserine phosphatase